ncbi:MAG: DUF4127 family protein [Bacilli bacterium]|nr:DUF4127 family protein [Bacilli bacterium]
MAQKIIYLPLDERPCNYQFPLDIFADTDIGVTVPPSAAMGQKKQPGDYNRIKEFLLTESENAYGAVISIDTLLYGGIVPSRLHYLSESELSARLDLLSELKKRHPKLIIYAFQLIMRTPQYSFSEEEPDYYAICGREIFLYGYYQNKAQLGIITDEERKSLEKIQIEPEYLNDYLKRRELNAVFNRKTLDLLASGIIDFLIIPQDDASEYGYPSIDQAALRRIIRGKHLTLKAYMYPGADEVGCILLARMLNQVKSSKPRFLLKYPSPTAPTVIPCLEDRYLDVTVKYQVLAAGGIAVPALCDCDLVMLILIGAEKMIPNPDNSPARDIDVLSNLAECFEFGRWAVASGYPLIVADLLYLNGGSLDVLSYIKATDLLMRLAAYSGWNTSSNALGTAIAQGIVYYYYGDRPAHRKFLVRRYLEDIGYDSFVRKKIWNELADYGMDYFSVKEEQGLVACRVEAELNKFFELHLSKIKKDYQIAGVRMPWKRMFEVDFKVVCRNEDS